MKKVSNNENMDIVIAWVDGSDKKWLDEKNKYLKEQGFDRRLGAYRDWDLLKYWFRGIEKNVPWVNKVYFVTWGHTPSWLNKKNEKLVIVRHDEFIPKEYLPTFSSHPIEINLHRIKGLKEKFSYFNADMYIIDKMYPEDFFINGIPCDRAVLNINIPKLSWQIQKINNNNISVINEEFEFRSSIKKNFSKWINFKYGMDMFRTLWLLPCPRFPGIKHEHANGNYLKSTCEEVWNRYFDIMDSTSKNKFRNPNTDINQWLYKDWQIASGNFIPQKRNSYFCDLKFRDKFNSYIDVIKQQKCKIVCINDADDMEENEFLSKKEELIKAFNKILPDKSSFEL